MTRFSLKKNAIIYLQLAISILNHAHFLNDKPGADMHNKHIIKII